MPIDCSPDASRGIRTAIRRFLERETTMSFDTIALLWATPFLGVCLTLAVLMVAADWQSSKGAE
jgi:hypothetical protein